MSNVINATATHGNKFSARVQGFKVAEDCVSAINAASTTLSQLRAKMEGAEATAKAIRESNLPEALKEQMIANFGGINNEYDAARIHAHETLAGIVNGIRSKLVAPESEKISRMDVLELSEIVATATDLYKSFGKLFPSKVVSQ